jgi:hypothetical protein
MAWKGPGVTTEKQKKFQPEQPVSELRNEYRTFQIKSKKADHLTAVLGVSFGEIHS